MPTRPPAQRSAALALLAGLMLAACGPTPTPVAVAVTPGAETLAPGATKQLQAQVTGTSNQAVTWGSSNPSVASVDSKGLVTVAPAAQEGTVTITATSVADPKQKGSANITVKINPAVSRVTVSPPAATLAPGATQPLNATVEGTGTFDRGVTWTSSDPSVASVDSTGLVTVAPAAREGTVTITAVSVADPKSRGSATITVKVNPAVSRVAVSPPAATLAPGATQDLSATVEGSGTFDGAVTWTSSDSGIATVAADGRVTAIKAGNVTIKATSIFDSTKSATSAISVVVNATVTRVTVTPTGATLDPGATQSLSARVEGTGSFSQNVTWTTSDAGVATVSGTGLVTAVNAGTATITATSTLDKSKSASATITVNARASVTGVSVNPSSATLEVGATRALGATVTGTGAYSPDVTWSSSNSSVASVSGAGVVTAVSAGQATITATSVTDVSKTGTSAITVTATAPSNARIALANLDGGPFADWLSFSKADRDLQGNVLSSSGNEHTVSTLRISNTGTDTLTGNLNVTGNYQVLSPATFNVAPGAFTDVRVQFTGSLGPGKVGAQVQTGSLTVSSNDATAPTRVVTLAAAIQWQYENNAEPTVSQLVNGALGFRTDLSGGGDINHKGSVLPQGDEVISPYWQAVDPSAAVSVWQLGAYHTQGNVARLYWHDKGTKNATQLLAHKGANGQSLLPLAESGNAQARTTFSPGSRTFGFMIDTQEWSDPALNAQQADINNGCTQPCGQHLRFYRAKDPSGALMPDTYLVVMDYAGINYDYNDNIYLISNVRPAPILMDTGVGKADVANKSFTDPAGNVWTSDIDAAGYKYFTPGTAVNEPASPYTGPIAGTSNPQLYRTYRGNVGNVPQNQRTITYTIPLENTSIYTVKLHFADLNSTVAGQRVFDVQVNGQVVFKNLDVFAESGGRYAALVKTIQGVQAANGRLTLTLSASVDYPEINGIEISR